MDITEPANERSPHVVIPFKEGHYQFTFKTEKGVNGEWVRRIYKAEDMNDALKLAKEQALRTYPKSFGHVIHSPQC